MKRWLMVVIWLASTSVAPGLAAPQPVEDFCFAQAAQVRPALAGRGEWEAFMANCIANYTPGPPAKRGRYKEPR
jgi:hypothetical protein